MSCDEVDCLRHNFIVEDNVNVLYSAFILYIISNKVFLAIKLLWITVLSIKRIKIALLVNIAIF